MPIVMTLHYLSILQEMMGPSCHHFVRNDYH